MQNGFDVIVVGAGHAGVESAFAAARMGAKVAIFVIKMESIGRMSCNPSIGGPAKGHLAREIDAMGGEMGFVSDLTGIHYRMLNQTKGPAVWAPRAQNDRDAYSRTMRAHLEAIPNIHIIEATVCELLLSSGRVTGVKTMIGCVYHAPAVIIASGTFLRGKIHVGKISYSGGRSGEPSADQLSLSLSGHHLEVLRFKTGTPPRIDMRSLDYSALETQPGDDPPGGFSFYRDVILQNKVCCYLSHTTAQTHRIINENLNLSALYSGIIEGIGPRYCPSIEDKIVKFPQRDSHHIFIEPEGTNTFEGYVNGISTSLPPHIQEAIVHSIPGMEQAKIMRYAYAIEYDYVSPTELELSLQTKKIKGLYLAGQINGTSGYEEAAAQGLVAGINATLELDNKEPIVFKRSEAYIGVLIDDLITCGTNEPYRMFTSRAEYRLKLRQDNADERLMPTAHKLGLLSQTRWERFCQMLEVKEREMYRLQTTNSLPHPNLKEPQKLCNLLKRPEIGFYDLTSYGYQVPDDMTKDIASRIELEIKYEGYLKRQEEELLRFSASEEIAIPKDLDYFAIDALAYEAREKLHRIRPINLGQAMRIPGVNYTDTSALMIWLRKNKAVRKES